MSRFHFSVVPNGYLILGRRDALYPRRAVPADRSETAYLQDHSDDRLPARPSRVAGRRRTGRTWCRRSPIRPSTCASWRSTFGHDPQIVIDANGILGRRQRRRPPSVRHRAGGTGRPAAPARALAPGPLNSAPISSAPTTSGTRSTCAASCGIALVAPAISTCRSRRSSATTGRRSARGVVRRRHHHQVAAGRPGELETELETAYEELQSTNEEPRPPTRSCSPRSRNWRRPTKSCNPRTKNWRR